MILETYYFMPTPGSKYRTGSQLDSNKCWGFCRQWSASPNTVCPHSSCIISHSVFCHVTLLTIARTRLFTACYSWLCAYILSHCWVIWIANIWNHICTAVNKLLLNKIFHLILSMVLWTKYYFSHLTGNKSEIWETKQLCLGSHG